MVRASRAAAGLPFFRSLIVGNHIAVASVVGAGATRARRPPLSAAAGAQATARAAIGSSHFVTFLVHRLSLGDSSARRDANDTISAHFEHPRVTALLSELTTCWTPSRLRAGGSPPARSF